MKSYSENITAGKPLVLPVSGRVLYIQRSAAGPVLDVEFIRNSGTGQKIERVGKGFKAAPVNGFEGIKIAAAVSGIVDFVVTDGDIQIQFDEDETTIGNGNAQAIPVRTVPGQPLEILFGGTVSPVLGVVTVDNTDAQAIPVQQKTGAVFDVRTSLASAIVNVAPVAVTDVAAVMLAASMTRRGIRVKNMGANPVALGGNGIVFANAVVLLLPGETWNENEAPGAAWYCICEAGMASSVNIQSIT